MNLTDSLAAALKGKTMSVGDAAEAVQQAGYRTNSNNFRTRSTSRSSKGRSSAWGGRSTRRSSQGQPAAYLLMKQAKSLTGVMVEASQLQ